MTAPCACPYSALKLLRSTRNSAMESMDGKTSSVAFEPTSMLLTPSTVHMLAFDWLPLTDTSTCESSPVPRVPKAPPSFGAESPGTSVTSAA